MPQLINTDITENDVFAYLQNLKQPERINIFKKFNADFYTYLFNIDVNKLSLEAYNNHLLKSESDIENGKLVSQNDFEKEVEKWLK